MGVISLPTTFADQTVPTAAQFNGDFNAIVNEFNGNIDNANIKSGAGITPSKISNTALTLSDIQKATGKTLVNTLTTDVDGATITFNMDADHGNLHKVILGGNRILAVSNVSTNQAFVIILQQGSGGQTVTWWGSILWVGASAPTLTTTGSRYDIFAFIFDGTSYFGSIIGQNYG